ncbi:hypothetical protein EHQ12_04125 [Leptospira gomenensis]|uniref:Uncharacterized protein n=1 Tax=Leptospira gomenensis TaxID=2484974 RepID=A0A5F1YEY5_9LEPT|nr:hypothetical protein [Leptospira gomenensis]TGK36198.1 hypothetical protein EHQ17_04595 [Leptospira gomenensis]TGK42764.1 hypothetical protein EHQ07_13905 [Leptospira gomenensis]TGK42952.1 hypothetical protein EHQ12_04125 [Leptospira gomenensis]TGK54963.1 hypothetical protein EHQ13_18380 [Leptospira gomenensis]
MSATVNENQLILPNGEINPQAYVNDPLKKLEELQRAFPPDKFNMIGFSQFLMNRLPEGVTLLPQFVTVTALDLWDETNAEEVRLKPGHVMLRSEKVINIGQAMGIKLRKVREDREVKVGSVPHLEAAWVASMNLPDGTVVETSVVTKKLPLYTSTGKLQVHLSESLERKVKRNAIKELLNIPTAMPRDQAQKMWVCVKSVFDPDSEFGKNRLKEIQGSAVAAETLLFDTDTEFTPPPVFDPMEARKRGEEIGKKLQEAKSREDIKKIMEPLNSSEFDAFTWNAIRAIANQRHQELKPAGGAQL